MTIDLFRPFMNRDQALRDLYDVLGPDKQGRVYIGQGERVEIFEEALKIILCAPQDVLTTSSCTGALDLALHLCDVIPRTVNEPAGWQMIISTPMTCTATNSPIVTRGGTIMWADIDPLSGLIDPFSVQEQIENAINSWGAVPKAVMAVDWGGHLCDYVALRKVTDSYDIPIIQDAAHSFGATVGGEPFLGAGLRGDSFPGGDYTCFSFQAIKTLTTGDGGALVCPNGSETDQARLLRWYGLDRRSKADFRCSQMIREVGYKLHMNDIAATIGLANLPSVPLILAAQRKHANFYGGALQGLKGVLLPPSVADPDFEDNDSAFWLFTLLVSNRDSFTAFMAERDIMVSPVHGRNDVHPGFSNAAITGIPLPGVDFFAAHEVAIPVGWWLSADDVARVAIAVQDWSARSGEPLEPPKTRT
jgi:perosamine synthetase